MPNEDLLQFGPGVRHRQLWFYRDGDRLRIELLGTEDEVAIRDWSQGAGHQIEAVGCDDEMRLLDTQVDLLVAAMADLEPPSSGGLEVSPELRSALELVLAVVWESV
jgi:hypothetical protein